MLVNEHYQEALNSKVPESEIDRISEENAEISFNSRIEVFRSSAKVPCVKVSTDDDYPGLSPCFSQSSLEISSSMQKRSDWNHFGNWSTLRGSACMVSKETSGFCGLQLSRSARIRKFSVPLGTRLGRVWPNIVCWPLIRLAKAPRARIYQFEWFPWNTNFRSRILDGFGQKYSLSGTYFDRVCLAYPQRHSQDLEFQWSAEG